MRLMRPADGLCDLISERFSFQSGDQTESKLMGGPRTSGGNDLAIDDHGFARGHCEVRLGAWVTAQLKPICKAGILKQQRSSANTGNPAVCSGLLLEASAELWVMTNLLYAGPTGKDDQVVVLVFAVTE